MWFAHLWASLTVRLDAKEGAQLWIPASFLHGFCTLEDQTVVFYKVTDYNSPDHDAGVIWNDPDLGITDLIRAYLQKGEWTRKEARISKLES
jgi:dTDP-4-dehydrorhamnose 3,5-epimerase-like enzyme